MQISHEAAVNFLLTMANDAPGFGKSDTLLAVTTISFDISVLELFMPLVCGGNLVVATAAQVRDGKTLAGLLTTHNVSVMQATPATWRLLLNSGWSGKDTLKVLCGGEAFPPSLANELLVRCGEVWNMYGPTETTVWSLVEQIKSADAIFIGKPIANTRIYILDELLQPLPPGVPGELFIAGSGLSSGYLNRPELTAERFRELKIDGTTERIYGTGIWFASVTTAKSNSLDVSIIRSSCEATALSRAKSKAIYRLAPPVFARQWSLPGAAIAIHNNW